MLRKIAIVAAIVGLLAPALASAETTQGGYAACLSKELFDEWVTVSTNKDRRAAEHLLKTGCVILRAGVEVSVLDTGWTGWKKIRVYGQGDESYVLWTFWEAVK